MFDNLLKFFNKGPSSKDVAKDRLKLVLIHDRANVSPQFLETLKNEIIAVLKKYIDIEDNEFDIKLTKTEDGSRVVPALVANIPIKNMKEDKNTANQSKKK